MTIQGQCLCKTVTFELLLENVKFYKCYCSLCRKQSGTDSNYATIVPAEKFRWQCDEENVGSYALKTGFKSNFCRVCGNPVPNQLRDTPYFWIPAGLLADDTNIEVVVNIWVGSKAPWGPAPSGGEEHETFLEFERFMQLLHPDEYA